MQNGEWIIKTRTYQSIPLPMVPTHSCTMVCEYWKWDPPPLLSLQPTHSRNWLGITFLGSLVLTYLWAFLFTVAVWNRCYNRWFGLLTGFGSLLNTQSCAVFSWLSEFNPWGQSTVTWVSGVTDKNYISYIKLWGGGGGGELNKQVIITPKRTNVRQNFNTCCKICCE